MNERLVRLAIAQKRLRDNDLDISMYDHGITFRALTSNGLAICNKDLLTRFENTIWRKSDKICGIRDSRKIELLGLNHDIGMLFESINETVLRYVVDNNIDCASWIGEIDISGSISLELKEDILHRYEWLVCRPELYVKDFLSTSCVDILVSPLLGEEEALVSEHFSDKDLLYMIRFDFENIFKLTDPSSELLVRVLNLPYGSVLSVFNVFRSNLRKEDVIKDLKKNDDSFFLSVDIGLSVNDFMEIIKENPLFVSLAHYNTADNIINIPNSFWEDNLNVFRNNVGILGVDEGMMIYALHDITNRDRRCRYIRDVLNNHGDSLSEDSFKIFFEAAFIG